LKLAMMYLRMACLEEPPRSFKAIIALPTISLYFGWADGLIISPRSRNAFYNLFLWVSSSRSAFAMHIQKSRSSWDYFQIVIRSVYIILRKDY
jgi:hypothetical protein